MFALKDELVSILPKSTNAKTSQSKMDQVFMIILLLNLGLDFENIWEWILTRAVIPNFDKALARLLCHTFTTTQSMQSEITSNTSMMSLNLILAVIPEVDAVATEVKDNVLNAHTVIGLDTPVIDAISYMADLAVLLIWLSFLIIQRVRALS